MLALGGCCFINIFNNQMEVGVWGRRCNEKDARPGWNVQGALSFCLGQSIDQPKKRKKYIMTLDSHRSKYFHATTSQKHAAAINNGTKEGCEWQGAGRKRDSIILGAIKLGGDKK